MLDKSQLINILAKAQSIAIIGAKDNEKSPQNIVGRYLINVGFKVYPVHMVRKQAWGLATTRSLKELADHGLYPDIICLFRASQYCEEHAMETIALPYHPLVFWMQEGIQNEQATFLLNKYSIPVVQNSCIKKVHEALFPDNSSVFSCTRCGKCCEGRGGIVLSSKDLNRLSIHFHISQKEFLENYTEVMDRKPVLRTVDNGFCIFFRSGFGCQIHQARPDVCRAWPFFRGNLVDNISFTMAREDCPGISLTASHPEFAHAGYAYLYQHKLLANDKNSDPNALIIQKGELPSLFAHPNENKE